jgi:uncharacterized protein (TIGR03905 family)
VVIFAGALPLHPTSPFLARKGLDTKEPSIKNYDKKEHDMKHYTFTPSGVCARRIEMDIEDNIIRKVTFTGGCSGNTQGLSALLVGMTVDDAIARLAGIRCGFKSTSCPDQVAKALMKFKAEA